MAAVQAHLEIPTLNLAYKSVQISNAGPLRVDYANNVVTFEPSRIKGTGTDLEFGGTVPLQTGAAISANALGTVDLSLLQMMGPDVRSAGQVKLNVTARGSRANPQLAGDIRVVNASFDSASVPLGVQNINGVIAVQNDRIVVQQFSGQAGGGTIAATGFVAYRPSIQYTLDVATNAVRLRYPEGVRMIFHSNLSLAGTNQSGQLTGRVLIDRLSLTPDFDVGTFLDQFNGNSVPALGSGLQSNLQLNVAVQSANQLNAISSQMSLEGSVNLRVTGTTANPVILGRTNLTGGEIFFRGRRYEISRGIVNFSNPITTTPVVNVLVTTTVEQFNLNLDFIGPTDNLRTTYSSDPPLSQVDIINLLAFGKTTEESQANPGKFGTQSLLASGLAGQVSGQVQKLAGLSSLTIDPGVGTHTTNNPGATVALQQRVSKNLFFTFSTNVTNAQEVAFHVQYQINRRWSVSVGRDQYGGYDLHFQMHKNF
jgi:translocation and assembly module TamB